MTEGHEISAGAAEAREFKRAFERFLEWIHESADEDDVHPVVVLIREFLGADALGESVVSRSLPPLEQVNLQTALDTWMQEAGREVDVRGLHSPMHHETPDLESLVSGEVFGPLRLGSPSYVDLPNGPGSTLACLRLALLLVRDARGAFVVMLAGPSRGEGSLRLAVAGLDVAGAQQVLGELDDLRRLLNVYRGQVVTVSMGHMGVALEFAETSAVRRDDVVLPDDVLARIERHAIDVATHRDALRARGQHLKRGVLLFGPPGTGKTLTTNYLVGAMAGYTRFLLSGHALHAVGTLAEFARELQPAVLVLEDVDLVAEDRDFGEGGGVLFELLDAMDGAAADADILFLLTTNRSNVLEPALASRPGRVDVAVEIALPDADARRRLLGLYGATVPMQWSDADVQDVVERTEGVTASFVKELLRRAVLESLIDPAPGDVVTAAHMTRALDDLLDSSQEVTRSLLGVGYDPETAPPMRLGPARRGVSFVGLQAGGVDYHYDEDWDDD